jgi:hypothetical protein
MSMVISTIIGSTGSYIRHPNESDTIRLGSHNFSATCLEILPTKKIISLKLLADQWLPDEARDLNAGPMRQ